MAEKFIDLVSKEYLANQIAGKADSSSLGTAASKDYTANISSGSADLPTSGAVYTAVSYKINASEKGSPNGIAELDGNGLVPANQLPSYVDDVIEGTAQNITETGAGTYSANGFVPTGEVTPITLESGKTYVDVLSNIQYRWTGTGSNLVSMGTNLTLGILENTAYRGDRGNTAYNDSQTNKANIGAMGNLTTTEKRSLVGAVNELVSTKQDTLTFDSAPTSSSMNPVTSGGVYNATNAIEEDVADLNSYINYDDTVYGLEVDMEAKTFTRIAGAVGKSAGADFDSVRAFGGRRRCNVTDGGVVTAYYGDSTYTETGALESEVTVNGTTYPAGTHVQVMVECPKFYYKIVPLKVNKLAKGWSLKKARYYVSDKPRDGFKVHPDFVRCGKDHEFVYHSAYEGSLYDASASAYITDDAQVADFDNDMLSSIANAKPISGLTQNPTRANTRKLAERRGDGWEQMTIQSASATQLLMLIEYATFNMQSVLSAGNSSKSSGSGNESENTGATSSLGNASGEVTNANGIKIFSYRGEENFYSNIWKWLDGLNKLDQVVFIADHAFADDTKTGYKDAGITACATSGWISAFCYSEDFDWLFIPAECSGDSALPVGDYYWYAVGWRGARLGGSWGYGATDGDFCLDLSNPSSNRGRIIGGRLLYIPDVDPDEERPSQFSVVDGKLCMTYNR